MKSLLNELYKINGDIRIRKCLLDNGIGYVSQDSWIQNGTIKENILFGENFDADWYQKVIDACALVQDFRVS